MDDHGEHLGEVPPIPSVMQMLYLDHPVSEEHNLHGATTLNVILGGVLLLPILGFGHSVIQNKHFCKAVNSHIGGMTKIWASFVGAGKAPKAEDQERLSKETYNDLWKLILEISKSQLATKNIPGKLFEVHFQCYMHETHKFYQDQAASSQDARPAEQEKREEQFKGERMHEYIHRLRDEDSEQHLLWL